MTRPLRIEYEGAWHHVMNRGRGHRVIFPGTEAYEAFLASLEEAWRRFRLEVHGYCLMPNHYHLLVRTPLGNLGRAMRHVDGLYTQRHNRLVGTDGPLFRGRYKAILVDADAYLLSVSRYIHRNPVEATEPLVEELAEWRWSSYPAYIGQAKVPEWLETDAIHAALDRRDRHRGYQVFVEDGVDEELARFYANQRIAPILGNETFRERAFRGVPESSEVPKRARRVLRSPETVLEAVAAEWGLPIAALTTRGGRADRSAREARKAAMLLCREETGLTLVAIGELFGGIHYSAVGQNIRRLQEAMGEDPRFSAAVDSVMSRLDP